MVILFLKTGWLISNLKEKRFFFFIQKKNHVFFCTCRLNLHGAKVSSKRPTPYRNDMEMWKYYKRLLLISQKMMRFWWKVFFGLICDGKLQIYSIEIRISLKYFWKRESIKEIVFSCTLKWWRWKKGWRYLMFKV